MKKFSFLILLSFLCLNTISAQNKDNRSFQQIVDSIVTESTLIYAYDNAFNQTLQYAQDNRKVRKNMGEILTYAVEDSIKSVVLSKDADKIIAEYTFAPYEDIPTENTVARPVLQKEDSLLMIKHKIMTQIQKVYEVKFPEGDAFFNPIFIPFKDKVRGKEVQLYKFYLITETTEPATIPFGENYLYYANSEGKIFYNLQFNPYMPTSIGYENADTEATAEDLSTVTITYPEREPYIVPADMFLFKKYGIQYGLTHLKVISTALPVYFLYDWERDTMDVLMNEESGE